MQQVRTFWYRFYYGWMLVFSIGIVLGWAAAHFDLISPVIAGHFGLKPVTALLAGTHIIFSLTLYGFIKARNYPLAIFAGAMLFSVNLMNGLAATNPNTENLLYALPWLLMVMLNGMFGLAIQTASFFLTGVYVMLAHNFDFLHISPIAWFLLIADGTLAIICFQFWKKQWIDTDSQQVQQLTGTLKSRQAQSEILIESITDGIIVFDNEGRIGLLNSAASVMTQWPKEEAMGVDIRLVTKFLDDKGGEVTTDPFTEVLTSKASRTSTMTLVGRDKKQRMIVSAVISPIITPKSQEVSGAIAVLRDVSKERTAEQQRAEFISTASHEMRTPVAAIEGYLALAMNDKVSRIDVKARDYLEKAHTSTQHLGKLFQDLLTSAKAEDGRLSSHPVVVEMGNMLQHLTEDLRFSAEKKGLLVEFVIGSSHPTNPTDTNSKVVQPLYYVHADPDRLREVVTDLFDNAVKYTETGRVTVGITGNNQIVQFYVKDTGPGIPVADIPHLFQKFYRIDSSATRTIGGTGLGLFICRKIVELYSGRIWVESELNQGSTFYINLPRLSTQKATDMLAQESAHPELPDLAAPSNVV